MIEPRPNCFSIARMAASTALPRSARARSVVRSPLRSPLRRSAPRSVVIAMMGAAPLSSIAERGGCRPGDVRLDDSALVRAVLVTGLAPGLDDLHVGRWLQERLQL